MLRCAFNVLQCMFRGQHAYIYIGRNYNGMTQEGTKKLYTLMYVCSHCQHFSGISEEE